MPAIPRKTSLEKFHSMSGAGVPIVGGCAGTGIAANADEACGSDLSAIYDSGRYRMAGRG
ncbi:phosphoenolpyruvate hydrolase family protein, partial [Rhizobium ruizarguesonis]